MQNTLVKVRYTSLLTLNRCGNISNCTVSQQYFCVLLRLLK